MLHEEGLEQCWCRVGILQVALVVIGMVILDASGAFYYKTKVLGAGTCLTHLFDRTQIFTEHLLCERHFCSSFGRTEGNKVPVPNS